MIHQIALKALQQNYQFVAGETVIVAVSGGCDSVALLHILLCLRAELGIELHVASLNHGLRGAAGQADVDFVGALARRWQLRCTLGNVDVPGLAAAWGLGIEAAGRRARYSFLADVARQQGSRCVLTGHHALDQAETMLLHILRGSGLNGLGGMRLISPLPYQPAIDLLRPLLSITRVDLEAYCAAKNLHYRQDTSNADIKYRRNFLRHEVIGRLRQLNPAALGAFARLAEAAAVDEDYLAQQFAATVLPLTRIKPASWRIERSAFAQLHPALQRRFLRAAYRALAGDAAALSHKLTLELLAWLPQARVGRRRDLGAAVQVRAGYSHLHIESGPAVAAPAAYRLIPATTDIKLESGAPLCIAGLKLRLLEGAPEPATGIALRLPRACELRLRTRRPGERFKPRGMGGRSRKIKDWMIDRKIPRAIRDQIPLLCADGAVIAICVGATWHQADLSDFAAPAEQMRTIYLE